MAEANVRELIVTELKFVTSGTTRKNEPYTLWQVRATKPDGSVIPDMNLRTFEELPLNEVIKVRIDVHHSEKWNTTSYTLFRIDGNQKRGNAHVEALETLKARVSWLEQVIREQFGMEPPVKQPQRDEPVRASGARAQAPIGPPEPDPSPLPTPGLPSTGGGSTHDDSVPF
jgi:hypothetical protein